jgi:hypothetical protein
MRWPPLQNHLGAVSFARGGSLVPVVLVDFSAAFSVHAGFVRVRRRRLVLDCTLPHPWAAWAALAAGQMEASNLL